MWVTLLPFLLVANVDNVRRPPWRPSLFIQNMPPTEYEYTFEIALNMSLTNVTEEYVNYCRRAVGELKCRPKEDNILTCYFANGRGYINTRGNCTKEDTFYPEFELFRNRDPFEVRFSEDGIQDLIVSRRWTPRSKLDKIKAVLRQLDTGIYMRKKNIAIRSFEKKGSNCEYKIKLTHHALESAKDDNSAKGKSFQLAFASLSDADYYRQLSYVFGVRKVKEISKCPPPYIFGNSIAQQYNDMEVHVNTTASVTDIKISQTEFMSSTTTDAVMYTPTSRIMRIKQKLSIELKGITIEKFPLREIYDPALTNISTSSGLQDIPEKTYFITQQ